MKVQGAKPNETSKAKSKDPAAEAKKAKKIEKTKLEMDRLKKMTQSGMDLLTLGIYAVDGKELDDQEAADYSEGFVEVVRKKSKKGVTGSQLVVDHSLLVFVFTHVFMVV